MRVYHPPGPYQGNPSENVFCVADDMGTEVGIGFVMLLYQPQIFPERPVNLYLQMNVQPAAKHMLFGALLGQAMLLKKQFPGQKARIYTEVRADNPQEIEFCRHNGFKLDDAEDQVLLSQPDVPFKLPMSFDFGAVPLNNEYEQNAFLMRMNAYRVAGLSMGMLAAESRRQHFLAMAVFRAGIPIAEILVSGEGSSAYIIGMYVQPNFRRLGLAKAMLSKVMEMMKSDGVGKFSAFILRRSLIQQALVRRFRPKLERTIAIYPGIDMD